MVKMEEKHRKEYDAIVRSGTEMNNENEFVERVDIFDYEVRNGHDNTGEGGNEEEEQCEGDGGEWGDIIEVE